MKKFWILLTLLFFSGVLLGCETQEPTEEPIKTDYSLCKGAGYVYDIEDINDYELVWSDEFEVDGALDSTKWGYDVGGGGWGNNELQYYTTGASNAWNENGRMVIEARVQALGGRNYTSARVISKNKGDWKYGKIEVSAKLPEGVGTWPAIWMLPTDWRYGNWPNSGEIDIMEHVGKDLNKVHASIHTKNYNHAINTQRSGTRIIPNATTAFNTYTVEWLPDQILFFMNDVQVYRFKPSMFIDCPNFAVWPFDQRFHLLLNIAIGGNWGGPDVDDSSFPLRMEIDYVRVYQSETVTNMQKG